MAQMADAVQTNGRNRRPFSRNGGDRNSTTGAAAGTLNGSVNDRRNGSVNGSVEGRRNGRRNGSVSAASGRANGSMHTGVNGVYAAELGEANDGAHVDATEDEGTPFDGVPAGGERLDVLSEGPGWISVRYARAHRRPLLARGIEAALREQPGVRAAQANPLTGRVRVHFEPGQVSVREIGDRIRTAEPIDPQTAAGAGGAQAAGQTPNTLTPVPADSLCADPLGPCCYIGNYVGKQPPAVFKGSAERTALEAQQMHLQRRRMVIGATAVGGLLVLRVAFGAALMTNPLVAAAAAAATLVSGYPLLRDGFRCLTGRAPLNPNALIAAATVASLVLGEGLTALIVISLLNLGALLQMATVFRTRRAIQDLLSVGDREVWVVLANGTEVKVPLESLAVGDTVAVYADEKIPVDGYVVSGAGSVNQALVTGESMPVLKNEGDEAFAGTILEAGSLRIAAARVGADTEVGRLIDRVEQARELRAPMETIAETFSRRFVPVSFLLAAVTFLLTGDIRRAMTMLVIACPCAAGLSTPTAVTASIGNAAKRGVLIKGGANLEAAGRLDTIVLDKTGTLTTGKAAVTRVLPLDPAASVEDVLRAAATAEVHVKHPLAVAVLRQAREAGMEVPENADFEVLGGRGVRAELDNGTQIHVGNPRLMEEAGVVQPPDVQEVIAELRQQGQTAICVAVGGRLLGVIGVSDAIRPQAREALDALRRAGIERVILCTGDSEETASIVARELGLPEYYAEYLPDDKFRLVQDLKAAGHRVAMVGDGINDAPALALADVGIAMGTSGSDVAIEAADISLASDDLRDLATILDLSRHTITVVKQNYALALGVNGAGILVGAAGALNPILAAIVHNLSTIAVVANSGRLIGYQPLEGRDEWAARALAAPARRASLTAADTAADVPPAAERARVPACGDPACEDETCADDPVLPQVVVPLARARVDPCGDPTCEDEACAAPVTTLAASMPASVPGSVSEVVAQPRLRLRAVRAVPACGDPACADEACTDDDCDDACDDDCDDPDCVDRGGGRGAVT